MAALLALISAMTWGVADFVGGVVARRSSALQTVVLSTPAGFLLLIPFALLLGGDIATSVVPGIVAGAIGSTAILMLYGALMLGPMGVVSPMSAVIGAAIPVLVGLVRGERPGAIAYVGMALAVVAIVTVGLEPAAPTDDSGHQRVTPRALALALGSGVGIGAFLAIIGIAPSGSGIYPVVFARGTSSVILLVIAVVVARRGRTPLLAPGARLRGQAAIAGFLDAAANGVYALAAQSGLLSVVAVLSALYPAATVLLARYVLAERLRPAQKAGMATALVAAVMLALG